ncbi:hypothetical protein GQ53DRAFT_746769 [Thozetella sp. PMI_491]|nr:hypothetical protein GQ53DRAFT_746769 [Thozetella sp. PMI_491]
MATANRIEDTQAQTVGQEAAAWQAKVREGRRAGDPAANLVLAITAADAIEQRIADQAGWTEDERSALMAVKGLAYTAAADVWPGWEVNGPTFDTRVLQDGQNLAQRSADWTKKLEQGPVKEATGIWLVGAFDLALGKLDDAIDKFAAATDMYRAGSAPGLVLLTEGYSVIVKGLRAQKSHEAISEDLEKTVADINASGVKDGQQWIEQLRTALLAFSKPEGSV